MTDDAHAAAMLRLGLLSLLVPLLGPIVWLQARRALQDGPRDARLVWARRLGIVATLVLLAFPAYALLGGARVTPADGGA